MAIVRYFFAFVAICVVIWVYQNPATAGTMISGFFSTLTHAFVVFVGAIGRGVASAISQLLSGTTAQ